MISESEKNNDQSDDYHNWNVGEYTLCMSALNFGVYCLAYTLLNTDNSNNDKFYNDAAESGIVFW